jgi:hypothetical protein
LVAGTRPGGATRKPVRKYSAAERHCTVCGERLSAYNPGPNCFVHSTSAAMAAGRLAAPLHHAPAG